MLPFTCDTACCTPLPPKRLPPSRSSTASCTPVDAPDGAMARPRAPESSITSASTVGLPRESRTSRPITCSVALNYVTPSVSALEERRPIRLVGVPCGEGGVGGGRSGGLFGHDAGPEGQGTRPQRQ